MIDAKNFSPEKFMEEVVPVLKSVANKVREKQPLTTEEKAKLLDFMAITRFMGRVCNLIIEERTEKALEMIRTEGAIPALEAFANKVREKQPLSTEEKADMFDFMAATRATGRICNLIIEERAEEALEMIREKNSF